MRAATQMRCWGILVFSGGVAGVRGGYGAAVRWGKGGEAAGDESSAGTKALLSLPISPSSSTEGTARAGGCLWDRTTDGHRGQLGTRVPLALLRARPAPARRAQGRLR